MSTVPAVASFLRYVTTVSSYLLLFLQGLRQALQLQLMLLLSLPHLEVRRRLQLLVAKQIIKARRPVGFEGGRVVDQRVRSAQLRIQLEKLIELLAFAHRDEEGTCHARLLQPVFLLAPGEGVVPAEGSAEVAEEDDHTPPLLSQEGAGGDPGAGAVC